MRTLSIILILLLIMTSIFIGGRKSLINWATFFPQSGSVVDITQLPHPIEHHFLQTSDGVKISTFFLPREGADKTFLYFHGNAGNASHRLPVALELWGLNANVLLVDYRGYGLSQGSPSEKGIYVDAETALQFLVNNIGVAVEEIFLFGRSIGSAVAVELAQHDTFAGVILISPLSSGKDVSANTGLGLASLLIGNPFNSKAKLHNLTSPLLILHGENDEILPIEMGLELRDISPVPTKFIRIPNAGHNDIIQINPESFYSYIRAFCE